MRAQHIAKSEIDGALASLIGLPISRAWRGYGSTIFLELGTLSPYENQKGNNSPRGEVSLMINWSWRFEKDRSIWFGAFSGLKKIDNRLPQLLGHIVKAASLEGRLPEIRLALSDNLWFSSFMCEQGQQEWVIFDSSHAYYAKARSFYKEPRREANKSVLPTGMNPTTSTPNHLNCPAAD